MDESPLAVLAAATGLHQEAFIDLFGAEWRRMSDRQDGDRHESDLFSQSTQLFAFGDPLQLIAKVTPALPHPQLTIGLPKITWAVQTPCVSIVDEVAISFPVDEDEVRPIVTRLLKKRRRTFRYCRYCGRVTPPEHGGDVCHGCMSRWLGVVF